MNTYYKWKIEYIEVKKLVSDAKLPERQHRFDAGADLFTPVDGFTYTILPGDHRAIPTGISVNIPPGYVGLIHPRSGLAANYGITVLNAPGTIDHGYTGEVKVILLNTSNKVFDVIPGMRIAQLVVQHVALPEFHEVESQSDTERGAGGFGSTGWN